MGRGEEIGIEYLSTRREAALELSTVPACDAAQLMGAGINSGRGCIGIEAACEEQERRCKGADTFHHIDCIGGTGHYREHKTAGTGGTMIPTREQALELLRRYTKNENLVRHGLSVESVMRHFAQRFGEDEEKWGIVGLVHDLDWEMYPEQHCAKTKEILEEEGWPDDYIRSVLSHGWGIVTEVKPEHQMEKALYATDELTGLVVATALMRPSRSILDMAAKSVKKKWKEKSFAAGVNRDVIQSGAEMLGMELSELITETIGGMRLVAEEIGLKGSVSEG